LNAQDKEGQKAAAQNDDLNVVKMLTEAGADVEMCDNHGRNALHHSMQNWNESVLAFLASTHQLAKAPSVMTDRSSH